MPTIHIRVLNTSVPKSLGPNSSPLAPLFNCWCLLVRDKSVLRFLLVLLIGVVPSHGRTYESKSMIMNRTTEPYESMSNVSVTKGKTVAYL